MSQQDVDTILKVWSLKTEISRLENILNDMKCNKCKSTNGYKVNQGRFRGWYCEDCGWFREKKDEITL